MHPAPPPDSRGFPAPARFPRNPGVSVNDTPAALWYRGSPSPGVRRAEIGETTMPNPRHAAALATLRAFTDANARADEAAMRAVLTRSTLDSGNFSGPMPADITFSFGEPEDDDQGRVVIPMAAAPPGEPADSEMAMLLRCILIEEDGVWKFDLEATMHDQMAAAEAAFRELGDQIGQAMGGAMEAIGEGLVQALGASGELDGESAEPVEPFGPADWRPLPALTTLENLSASLAAAVGVEIPVVADVQAMLDLFGADDPAPLIPWLENDLCAGLVEAIAAVGEDARALRAVRIEVPSDYNERMLILDGRTLVYRAEIRNAETNAYSVGAFAHIVPGVVHALRHAPDDLPDDHTALPTTDIYPNVQRYAHAWAPRFMAQVRAIVGGPVTLDADWDGFYNDSDGRTLVFWGLGRIPGALAMHARANDLPPGWLREIRFECTYEQRRASFADGVLTLAIATVGQEYAGLYEFQLAQVLATGEWTEPDEPNPNALT